MDAHAVLVVSLIAVAVLNAAVSLAVALNRGYGMRQKVMQMLLVWTVPILGGLLLGLFLLSQLGQVAPTAYPQEASDEAAQLWSAFHSHDREH